MNAVDHGFTAVVNPDFAADFEDALRLDNEHLEEPDEAHHATTTTLASSAPVNVNEEKREALATPLDEPESLGRGHASNRGRGRGRGRGHSTGRGGRRRHHHSQQQTQFNIDAQAWAPHVHPQYYGVPALLGTRPPFDMRYAQPPMWMQQQYMTGMPRPPQMPLPQQYPHHQHPRSPLHNGTSQKDEDKRK